MQNVAMVIITATQNVAMVIITATQNVAMAIITATQNVAMVKANILLCVVNNVRKNSQLA